MTQIFNNVNLSRENSLVHLINQYDIYEDTQIIDLKTSNYVDETEMIKIFNSKKDMFNIVSLNIQSLNAKYNEFRIFVENINSQINKNSISVILLQEARVDKNTDLSTLTLPHYKIFKKNKSCSANGGLITYVHESFSAKLLNVGTESKSYEKMYHEIKYAHNKKAQTIIIGNIYRPPRNIVENIQTFCEDLNKDCIELSKHNKQLYINGDYNLDLLKLHNNNNVEQYFQNMCTIGLKPKITRPTRISNEGRTKSLIDNIWSNDKLKCFKSCILINHLSDHQLILTSDYYDTGIDKVKYIELRTNTKKHIEKLINSLKSENIINRLDVNIECNPNYNYNILSNIINDKMNEYIPIKKVKFNPRKHKRQKWVTDAILHSITYKNKLYVNMKNSSYDPIIYQQYKTNFNTYNKILKKKKSSEEILLPQYF